MFVKTYATVFLRFFIEYRRFYNNLEISIISVLRIFIELRVSDVIYSYVVLKLLFFTILFPTCPPTSRFFIPSKRRNSVDHQQFALQYIQVSGTFSPKLVSKLCLAKTKFAPAVVNRIKN